MNLIRLACPSCGENGTWTVDGRPQSLTLPGGEQAVVVAGRCARCGSRVWCDPSETAIAEIGDRALITRTRAAELRQTMKQAAR